MLRWTCAIRFSAAALSENDHGRPLPLHSRPSHRTKLQKEKEDGLSLSYRMKRE